ncbi:putative tryptophan dimethylallyltransferase [Lyophyllum shimeji]|uniref:Tryptophan dimethylallyltransferase n=1 Tax=Lyophyllum shimeji TaxID=47721 RepID=A0A9P3PUA1_LYOSH|nr:putative tryptophan dimethylallyltransferase [Lyophyllum shimeji]
MKRSSQGRIKWHNLRFALAKIPRLTPTAVLCQMDTLAGDPRFFAQIPPSTSSLKSKLECLRGDGHDYVMKAASTVLGSDFKFNPPSIIDDSEATGLAIYDTLTKILPARSPQSVFFWRKFGRCFASMLDTAEFPISSQISFLTFVYARLLGMMGPLEAVGPGSLMTFDGSPVELSWVMPRGGSSSQTGADRQLRFAIEPIDPRSGKLLRGSEVLKYLTSPNGSLGLVRCDKTALDWSMITQDFLYPDNEVSQSGKRFFVGFDFSRSGDIVLKTYYLPSLRPTCDDFHHHPKVPRLNLWDVEYSPLRDLVARLDPTLLKSLDVLISYVEDVDVPFKPRVQILSMDCVPNEVNRLKLYCRPTQGSSWSDARRAFTLGGRLTSAKMDRALARLEMLWNLLFPFADSRSSHDLDDSRTHRTRDCHRGTPDHPTGGLLYYYSLVPGSDIVLPKIYLPVARYCRNDLAIAEALEQFHAIDGRGTCEQGWVSREVSAAYNHRDLSERTGIHTYVTFALKKNYEWELTTYFSPEVWESSQ